METTIDGAEDVIVNVTGGLDMTLIEAEEASEIVSQAAGKGVNIWLGTSIDDTMKDEIRVTVVATGVRQDKADRVSGFKTSYGRPVVSKPTEQQGSTSQFNASNRTAATTQPSFERQNFDMGESREMPKVTVANQANQQAENAFGNWDLKRDNISSPSEGELDTKLSMSTFNSSDDSDDELEIPPFFRNR